MVAQLVWLSGLSAILKTQRFQCNSQWGHMSGLQARSPVGGVHEATTHWCFSPSLSPFLPLSLEINKIVISPREFEKNCYLIKGVYLLLCTSKPKTGICSKQSKGFFFRRPMPRDGLSNWSKIWLSDDFQGMSCIGEKSLIMVTKGVRVIVRVMVSTDWSVSHNSQ